jgi:hypothetical protein
MVDVINPGQHSATMYKSPTDIIALAESDVLAGGDIVPGFELVVQENVAYLPSLACQQMLTSRC